jgi:four helix bundle protein
MKARKKTPNAQRRTTRWIGGDRVEEGAPSYGTRQQADSTLNTQRSTSKAQGQTKPPFDLEDRLLEFSARIIRLADALPNIRAANHLAGQLLRCGTSPYGNHDEVEAAESRKDFIHKLKICLKELKETRRWLRLAVTSGMATGSKMDAILVETEELIRIFFSSVRAAERNAK